MANSKGEFVTWKEYRALHGITDEWCYEYVLAHCKWVTEYNPNFAGGDADKVQSIAMNEHTFNQLKEHLK